MIELVSTVRRDAFERCGEFGLTENLPRLEKFLIVEQNAAGFRVAAERDRPREHLRSQVAHRMSFGRQFDRRRDQTRPRQASGDAVLDTHLVAGRVEVAHRRARPAAVRAGEDGGGQR